MTDELPNHEPVTLAEALDQDEQTFSGPGKTLREWVTATNAQREAAKAAYAEEPITIGDVTFQPGDLLTITVHDGHRKDKTRRRINCLYLGRNVSRRGYGKPDEITRWLVYGGKDQSKERYPGYANSDSIIRWHIVSVVRVDPVPAWITQDQAEGAARSAKDAALMAELTGGKP